MAKLLIFAVIVIGVFSGVWIYYEPKREKMLIHPVRFLYECYENQEAEVSGWSESDFQKHYYALQSRDSCYEEFTRRMDDLPRRIEMAKQKKGVEDPYTRELLKGFDEGERLGKSIQEFWYLRGWRERARSK